jgi:hypothetical protein
VTQARKPRTGQARIGQEGRLVQIYFISKRMFRPAEIGGKWSANLFLSGRPSSWSNCK